MYRVARIALSISLCAAIAILVGGLIPRDFAEAPIRRDGPYLHAVAFALFTLPLVWAWPQKWLAIITVAMLFGGAVEIVQPIYDRAFEWPDILANAIGALTGTGLGRALAWRTTR